MFPNTVVPVPPHILERQRARDRRVHHLIHPSDPTYRRAPADSMRSGRRPSVSTIAPRPPRSRRSSMPDRDSERNMLQREYSSSFTMRLVYSFLRTSDAWHTVMTTDPLIDSDEECRDGYVRTDYGA